jgi:GNAT superfamily N-acetyltransferase
MIRAIKVADIPEVASSYVASFREIDPSEQWTEAKAQALVGFFLNAQPDLAFLFEKDGRVAGGILGLVKPWWDGNCLVDTEVFVTPEYKQQGVGTQLGLHYLQFAVKRYDVRSIHAVTFKDFEFPASLYRSLGFEDKLNWKVVVADVPALVKRLGATRHALQTGTR